MFHLLTQIQMNRNLGRTCKYAKYLAECGALITINFKLSAKQYWKKHDRKRFLILPMYTGELDDSIDTGHTATILYRTYDTQKQIFLNLFFCLQ